MFSPLRHAGSILWKRRPVHLTFFLTRKCNAHCPFCFYLKSPDHPQSAAPELTLAEIERISRSLGRLLWLAFSGGEVYLRKDLVEISKVFYDRNRPAVMLYPSNGMLPDLIRDQTDRIAAYCRDSIVVVKLSLDGVGTDHDTLRNTRGNFDKTMQTYARLQGLLDVYPNFELGFNTVLTAQNQDKIEEIVDFVGGLDKRITHTISMVRGNLLDNGYKQVDPENYRRAAEILATRLRERTSGIHRFRGARLKAAQDVLQRRFIHQTLTGQDRSLPCYAGKLNLVLTESGEVYPCEILPQSLGNVRDHGYDIMRVTRAEKAGDILRSISVSNPHCRTCTHECNYITNILFNPAIYPALMKEYLRQ
ncbi:MAG: radical SAM protein [Gammaproteobacteria bacterium]